jgi:pyocin large subunit-like protein
VAAVATTFQNVGKLMRHFQDHGSDFGAVSAAHYEQLAAAFLNRTATTISDCIRPSNGDIIKYDRVSDEFAVMQNNGTIRTYYKPNPLVHLCPTNLAYFEANCL